LDKIGYPYVVNRDLNATKRLWIHDDLDALRFMGKSKAFKVVGPNLVVMPKDLPIGVNFQNAIYLQPSEWAAQLWQNQGFDACPLRAWPVGIDTEEFQPSIVPENQRKVLVYHKQRDVRELTLILETLHEMRIPYWLMLYGHYNEQDYKQYLSQTSFIIWHGCHESQGIALEEAMACDIPVLVWDVTSLAQAFSAYKFSEDLARFKVTAIPYFDDLCGIRITKIESLEGAIQEMFKRFTEFHPRQFIVDHLSLERMAKALVNMWTNLGLNYDAGFSERLTSSKSFRLPIKERIRRRLFS